MIQPLTDRIVAMLQDELNRTRLPGRAPKVTADAELVRDLRCCGLDFQCLAMDLDELFNIEIPDRFLEEHSPDRWHTPADIARTVETLLAPQPAGEL